MERMSFKGEECLVIRLPFDLTIDEVDARRSEKLGHEPMNGLIVNFGGCSHLNDFTFVHYANPFAESHGLDLIVGDVKSGALMLLMNLGQFVPH